MPEQAQPTAPRGAIYAAKGEIYVETARRSARSLRKHNPNLPIHLFSDVDDTSGVFDAVHTDYPLPDQPKVGAVPFSPFAETLYLDCDTIVRANLDSMFDLLQRFDLAVAHVVLWNRKMHQQTDRTPVPECFAEPNMGVFLYRTDTPRMASFLAKWKENFDAYGGWNDQIMMRELLWSEDVRFYVLPEAFNKRVIEASELIYTDRPKPRIFHLKLLNPQKNPIKRWLADRIR